MVARKKTKISIILIHNNNKERYNYIKPRLDKLVKDFLQDFDIDFSEISKQTKVIPKPTYITVYKKYLLWKISREWREYLKNAQRFFPIDLLFLLGLVGKTFKNRSWENWRSGVDAIVTDKHIRAWNSFLEKDSDFLICFEDDAVFNHKSITDFKKLLQGINRYNNKLVYVNFTSGCSPKELKFEKIFIRSDNRRKYYRKPVTNTGCCYMVNRHLAELFSLNLLKNPDLRLLSFDWLLNKIFIITEPKYEFYCYHADPPIFNHGSIKGNYESWLSLALKRK